MSKQVKEAKEHLEGRNLLEKRKFKYLDFQFSLSLCCSEKCILLLNIYSGESTNLLPNLSPQVKDPLTIFLIKA